MPTTILLIRHAQRANNHHGPDRSCPISQAGRATQEKVAHELKTLGLIPNRIYFSPTRRTEETAAIMGAAFHIDTVTEPALAFAADEGALFALVPDPSSNETIAWVGHGPPLLTFAQMATREIPIDIEMATSSVIVLQFDGEVNLRKAKFLRYINAETSG